jgi:hypothetical protein
MATGHIEDLRLQLLEKKREMDTLMSQLEYSHNLLSHNETESDKLAKLLAVKLASATAENREAEHRALESAESYVRDVTLQAQESNYMLWSTLAREQAKRRENHDRIELMKGPVRVYCRIRPLTSLERSKGLAPIVRCLPSGVLELNLPQPRDRAKAKVCCVPIAA